MGVSIILRLALVIAATGLIILFAISSTYTMGYTRTYDISTSDIGKDIRIRGSVISVRELDKLFLVKVAEEKPVTVVVFKDGRLRNFSQGSRIDVFGQVREFEGSLEVVAEKVSYLR
ncbi:hypothetical protein HYY72_00530 [Candidatus Woesearchaeota archaeon]|nr:hypothetical protein [Candidatus Woesearchaeota archaeon]